LQEETYYLGKPCLVLRKKTERIEGLGENVVISEFKNDLINDFLCAPLNFSRNSKLKVKKKPSEKIVDRILDFG